MCVSPWLRSASSPAPVISYTVSIYNCQPWGDHSPGFSLSSTQHPTNDQDDHCRTNIVLLSECPSRFNLPPRPHACYTGTFGPLASRSSWPASIPGTLVGPVFRLMVRPRRPTRAPFGSCPRDARKVRYADKTMSPSPIQGN